MSVRTRKEYEQTKETTKVEAEQVEKPAPTFVLGQVALEDKIFVLQDPETRTFTDTIRIGNRDCIREVVRGTLKTRDSILCDFMVSKGWILIDTLTKEV